MAGIFLAKRAAITVSKSSPKNQHCPTFVDSATRISSASCFSDQAANNVDDPETRGEGTIPGNTTGISSSQSMYEARQQALDPDEDTRTGVGQFVTDNAKEGVRKATEMAVNTISDEAKRTMEDANQLSNYDNEGNDGVDYDQNNNATDQVVDGIKDVDGPVDTAEYRSMESSIDGLKKAAEDN